MEEVEEDCRDSVSSMSNNWPTPRRCLHAEGNREGPSYQSVHQQRVRCLDGAADLEAGSLESHRQKKKVVIHSVSWEITPPTDPPTMAPIIYHVSLLRLVRSIACPEEGCQGRVMIHTNFHLYFDYWHVRDTVAILGEGKRPHQ